MKAVSRQPGIELRVVETTNSDDHGWKRDYPPDLKITTLTTDTFKAAVVRKTATALQQVLYDWLPDVVVAAGYSDPHIMGALLKYKNRHPKTSLLLWSETTEADHVRNTITEKMKKLLASTFDGALVAGTPHAHYLKRLGLKRSRVRIIGGCVDNAAFKESAENFRTQPRGAHLPKNYFLYVGRLIPAKNLDLLIDGYHDYHKRSDTHAWDLVIVGSGAEERRLRDRAGSCQSIHFAGLKQPHELPEYYAHARCFVLPSKSEPWGLVVNEAMASGLPVLVSRQCGCAEDLVVDGKNGFIFEPDDRARVAELLTTVSNESTDLASMGQLGQKIVAEFNPETFAQRAVEHMMQIRSDHRDTDAIGHRVAGALTQLWKYVC